LKFNNNCDELLHSAAILIQPRVPLNAASLSKLHDRIVSQLVAAGTFNYTMICEGHLSEYGKTSTEAYNYFFQLYFIFILVHPPKHDNFFKY
jgi:hypothetical protein